MEGPTPSSAIFYGALSVHLGAFLLLRVSPLLERSLLLSLSVVAVGAATAIFGGLAARVQTDIKSALAFASLTQVGLIVVEIGCGLRIIALIHMLGHACLRTLQLLRAPTLLHDYHMLENAIGGRLKQVAARPAGVLPTSLRKLCYRVAWERGFFDAMLHDYAVRPFRRVFGWCDSMERRWTCWLSGGVGQDSREREPQGESLEDFV